MSHTNVSLIFPYTADVDVVLLSAGKITTLHKKRESFTFCRGRYYSPKFDPNFANIRKFLSGVNADLSDLKSSFGLDFFKENSPGFELICHMIFSKLPTIFQRELIWKFDSNYPEINQIFDGYNKVLKTLNRTS